MQPQLSIRNIAGYCFCDLGNLEEAKAQLQDQCGTLNLKGTILVAPEGINLFLAGQDQDVEIFLDQNKDTYWLPRMILHTSYSADIPFARMLVKIKKEIIAFGEAGIDPATAPAPYIYASELKALYEKGEEFLLLDTRNDYEVRVGTFKGAQNFNIDHFKSFPEELQALLKTHKDTPIVTTCTGGVRCEKAAPFMLKMGFTNVRQLHGGFLSYFKACGDAFYDGDCFVFDKRVAVDPFLQETHMKQCYACRNPLTEEDLENSVYEEGISCPHCYNERAVKHRYDVKQRVQDDC